MFAPKELGAFLRSADEGKYAENIADAHTSLFRRDAPYARATTVATPCPKGADTLYPHPYK